MNKEHPITKIRTNFGILNVPILYAENPAGVKEQQNNNSKHTQPIKLVLAS